MCRGSLGAETETPAAETIVAAAVLDVFARQENVVMQTSVMRPVCTELGIAQFKLLGPENQCMREGDEEAL